MSLAALVSGHEKQPFIGEVHELIVEFSDDILTVFPCTKLLSAHWTYLYVQNEICEFVCIQIVTKKFVCLHFDYTHFLFVHICDW